MAAWIPLAFSAVSTALDAKSKSAAGNATAYQEKKKAALSEFEAQQLDSSANQSIASSQRAAEDQRLNAALVSSRALAVAASSGGGASDPTIVNLMSKIAGEGQYRAMTAMYQGEDEARGLRNMATAKRFQGGMELNAGNSALGAGQTGAYSTVLSGAGSMYSKYWPAGGSNGGSGIASSPNYGTANYDAGIGSYGNFG